MVRVATIDSLTFRCMALTGIFILVPEGTNSLPSEVPSSSILGQASGPIREPD